MTQGLNPAGKMQTLKVDADGALIVAGGVPGGGGSAGSSNTTEATQLLVKAAVQNIDANTTASLARLVSLDSSNTTEATQLLVKAAVQSLDTKTPALEAGRVPVALPAGLATQATAVSSLAELTSIDANTTASLARLVSLDGKTPVLVQKQVVDEASSTVTYVGEAPLGTATSAAAWLIRRITTAGTITTIEYSPANSIFNDRASLGYT